MAQTRTNGTKQKQNTKMQHQQKTSLNSDLIDINAKAQGSLDDKSDNLLSSMMVEIPALSAYILSIYWRTLYPSIPGGDSGELVAEGCHLGIAHPPGYPLLTVLNSLVTKLPSKSPAWWANLLSAGLNTICCILMYLIVAQWNKENDFISRCAAASCAVAFAFSPLIWQYAVGAEVFALNNFLCACVLYAAHTYAKHKSMRSLKAGAFLSGLALTNQHTSVLLICPLISWVIWTQRKNLRPSTLAVLAGYFILGLLPYLYLPLTAIFNSQPGSWGDPASFKGFFHHLRRGDYGTFRLFSSDREAEGMIERVCSYFKDLFVVQFSYIYTILFVAGVAAAWRSRGEEERVVGWEGNNRPDRSRARQRGKALKQVVDTSSFGRALLASYVFYLVVFNFLSNMPMNDDLLFGVQKRFWLQPNILAFILGGLGLQNILYKFATSAPETSRPPKIAPTTLAAIIAVAIIIGQPALWFRFSDQSQNFFMVNYAKALLSNVPQNALVLSNYDMQWTALRYLQRCENHRRDVTIINVSMMSYPWFERYQKHYPHLRFPGSHLMPSAYTKAPDATGFSMRQFLDANPNAIKRDGIFLGGRLMHPDVDVDEKYDVQPLGLLKKFVPRQSKKSLSAYRKASKVAWEKVNEALPTLPPKSSYDGETWEYTVARDYHMLQGDKAAYQLQLAVELDPSEGVDVLLDSARIMEKIRANEPKNFVPHFLLKNLGLAYGHLLRFQGDLSNAQLALLPKEVTSPASEWRKLLGLHLVSIWEHWLAGEESKADSSYTTIKQVTENLKNILHRQGQSSINSQRARR